MTPARWTFVSVLGFLLALGLIIGLINLVSPDAVSITFNDERVTGMPGLWTALGVGAFLGVLFGLIIGGLVALFTRRTNID
jgi:hypothetical protein